MNIEQTTVKMTEYLRRCKDCHGVLDVRNIDWRCRWCSSQVFADTTQYGLTFSRPTGSSVSTNQTDRDESPIVHHTPPGARHALLASPMSRAVDDIHAVSVSTSGPMPQRSTRLVEAPSFTEGSQCPPQRPTSPPTPEFVTPVSSPQTSALLGGDMTRLSLGPPATQGSGAFLPARQTTAAQEVEVDAPPQRKKERDPNAEYGGLEHDPKLPSPEYHAGKVDWYPDLFEDQICRTLSPYHKRLIARMKAKWSTDFQCLRAVPDDAALRQNIALLVQEAWDVFKEYVPYWTSDPDWSMPPVLGERLREMQIAEAYRCVLRREYELEREVDFNPLYGPYDHRASPSAPGNCLRGKGPLRSVGGPYKRAVTFR